MKILIDIGHPAHVHLFRNLIYALRTKNHDILITARDKDVTINLLNHYNLNFKIRPSSSSRILSKFLGIIKITFYLWKISKKFHPDVLIGGVGNVYISILGWITRKPSLIFDDTENSKFELFFVKLFSKVIITPDCYLSKMGEKQIRYSGYHELAYLHPNQFTPNPSVKKELCLNGNENYSILRFVSWQASHDIGHSGISNENKIKVVNEFSKYTKVFITSEGSLPMEIENNRINISPEKMHDVLAFATLFYGESATMASESAVLGTPAIYIDNSSRGYTREEELKYYLVNNFTESLEDQEKSICKGVELLQQKNLKTNLFHCRQKLINDKIDVTAFIVWFVENFPSSFKIMKENQDYQQKFK